MEKIPHDYPVQIQIQVDMALLNLGSFWYERMLV